MRSSGMLPFLLVALAALSGVTDAAYRPGWSPPDCLGELYKPTNVSIEIDRTSPGVSGGVEQSIQSTKFHVFNKTTGKMELFVIKGVGYSPLWPSRLTYSQPFDVFTSEYRYIWERDLIRIKEMGANTVRVWSWDSFRDHSDFLDTLYQNGLYIMVPFAFTHTDYQDLTSPATRKQALTDWKAFVMSVMNHPAVLCFLIGNELNTYFGAERQELFGLINSMLKIRDAVDLAQHPVTLPLSDVAFVDDYSNPFYQWSGMEFWSLQTYRPQQSIAKPIENYYYSYAVNMSRLGLPFKPLVLTEFGVDALQETDNIGTYGPEGLPPQPPIDETKQATFFCQMFSQARSNNPIPLKYGLKTQQEMSYAQVIGGAVIMEWNDEWWKGMFSDVSAPMCPNYRTELHTWCRNDVGTPHSPYYLHEEWLGITSQIYDPDGMELCLCPRKAYYSMQTAFQCNGDISCLANFENNPYGDGFGCTPSQKLFAPCDTKWCAYRRNIFLNPYISMILPVVSIFLALLAIAFYLRKASAKEEDRINEEKKATRQTMNEQAIGDGTYHQEESTSSTNGAKLRSMIGAAFLKYCNVGTTEDDSSFCPYFVTAQDRLFNLVWDTYLGFDTVSDQLLTTATRVVYERFMEAYHLWCKEPPSPLIAREEMFLDMALYSIVQAWAGTINHSPEKICEVFEFSKDYFANVIARNHGQLRVNQVLDFHHGLVEIFRSYYLKVDEGVFTFEDVNEDALLYRDQRMSNSGKEKKESFWHMQYRQKQEDDGSRVEPKQQRTRDGLDKNTGKACPELDLLPDPELKRGEDTSNIHPFLEYHKLRDPEESGNLLSDAGSCFYGLHEELVGVRWMKPNQKFAQVGGPFTLMFNYGWIIRYLLWQNLWAKYLQPVSIAPPMCLCDAVKYLAFMDVFWMLFMSLLHYRILGRFTKKIIFDLVVYTGGAVVVVLFNIIPGVGGTRSNSTSIANFFGFGYSINTFYLIGTLVLTLGEELRLLMVPHCSTYKIPARFTDTGLVVRTRIAYYTSLTIIATLLCSMWISGLGGSGKTIIDVLEAKVVLNFWPNVVKDVWTFLFLGCSGLIPYFIAKGVGAAGGKGKNKNKGKEEAVYLVCNTMFWGAFWAINWLLAFFIFVPSVNNIGFDTCICDEQSPNISEGERAQCASSYSATCFIAVIFTWLSAFLVSFVALFGSFEVMLLFFGLARGKYNRVGNVKTWHDVERNFDNIRIKCTKQISSSLLFEEKQAELWNVFMNALYDDCLLSIAERDRLIIDANKRRPDFKIKPRSEEAIRRVTYHLWSLESLLAHNEVNPDHHHNYRKAHRVRTMPTLTTLVPAYNETIIFEDAQLIRTRSANQAHLRITEIEYLVHTYPDEWDNLAEKLKAQDGSFVVAEDNLSMDLLASYLNTPGHPRISETLRFEIRWWATMRGQTLARTMQGFINWRTALLHLIKLEEEGIPDDEASRIVSRKYQIVIAHQTYNPNADINKTPNMPHEEAMEICFRKLKYFDLVYNDDKCFQSYCKRLKPEALLTADGKEDLKFVNKVTIPDKSGKGVERCMFNWFPKEAFETTTVQRVGRLKIGEGKAENQMGALQFVNGSVLQAIDMNQFATTENGFKVPYLLGDFFSTPHSIGAVVEGKQAVESNVIPPYRIVGFPEWAYTRSLSLVGELMGSAEWCFVTITQRVLDWPLRIRLHYGHPDFFDAFYVRNRGGQSKASQLVNTNEDIFAGYEMLGRGDRGSFVEFLEVQKGRETSFGGAFTFEAKLAQGGAQQCRSFDVYRLNRGLDVFSRFSLFFTSLAFYVTNLLMAVSINYYILSIALFAVSGITYHKLGLLDAVIAVPWLFQIGYVLAFPYLLELTIQRGFWKGLGQFIRTLPPGILFFIFHLRTKTYFFTQGLLIGKGGYAGTGRGFGLDRANFKDMYKAYAESHYLEALLIFAVLVVYAVYGSDPPGTYILRTFNIILIVISWMWAPILFNPAPTTQDLQNDTKEILDWITNRRHEGKNIELMLEKLDCVHLLRVHGLVSNLEAECKEYLRQSEEGAGSADNQSPSIKDDLESRAETATVSNFKGVMSALDAQDVEDMREALKKSYQILSKSRSQLQKIQTIDNAKPNMTLDAITKEYWGQTSNESWTGWFIQSVVISAWEGEDVFFPGLLNLMAQKVYLHIEVYAPWVLLCIDQYHTDSLWFLLLALLGVGMFYFVDKAFHNHHEYSALAKGLLILTVPTAFFFFHYGVMSFSNLFWSMVLYMLCISLCIRTFFGFINARAKFKRFGLRGNPHHVAFESCKCQTVPPMKEEMLRVSIRNRSAEMEMTNKNEQQRFSLLMDRMRFIRYITTCTFRQVIPLVCTLWLVLGNTLTVIISEWITTLNFNGRVNEAWKKAYLRPSTTNKDDDHGGGGGGGGAPLSREQQVAQAEAATTQAAVYGSLSSSLPAHHRRQMRAPASKNMLHSTRIPIPNAPASQRTLMSVGSFSSQQHLNDNDASRPMLVEHTSESYGSMNQSANPQRNAMHFLNNLTDKYRK